MQVSVPPILQSKKFASASLASILSFLGIHYGLTLEQIVIVTAPLYAYVGAQGVADFGKERAKIDRDASVVTIHNSTQS